MTSSASTTRVRRDRLGVSVGPTVMLAMLKPRARNRLTTRFSAPGSSSSRATTVWRWRAGLATAMLVPIAVGGDQSRGFAFEGGDVRLLHLLQQVRLLDQVVRRRARRNDGVDVLLRLDHEVDDHGSIMVDGGLDGGLDVTLV